MLDRGRLAWHIWYSSTAPWRSRTLWCACEATVPWDAYDPTVSTRASAEDLTGVVLHESVDDAAQHADVILILTEWPEFMSLDPVNLSRFVRKKNLVDARNLLDAELWRASGFAHTAATALMKDIFVARNALAAYFIVSADEGSV